MTFLSSTKSLIVEPPLVLELEAAARSSPEPERASPLDLPVLLTEVGNLETRSAKLLPPPLVLGPLDAVAREPNPPPPTPADLSPSLRLENFFGLPGTPGTDSLFFGTPSSSISKRENELRFEFLASSPASCEAEGG
jgi:hypothetical protein